MWRRELYQMQPEVSLCRPRSVSVPPPLLFSQDIFCAFILPLSGMELLGTELGGGGGEGERDGLREIEKENGRGEDKKI